MMSDFWNYFISRISSLFFICVDRLFTPYFKVDRVYIRNALPSNWKSHSGGFDFTSEITFNNVAIRKCSAGMFKKAMIESMYIKPTKCQHFWENKFHNNDFNWELIWSKIPHCTKEARLISLN